MIGMSLSPTIAGLFSNFFTSFIMALSIFAASILYLAIFVPTVSSSTPAANSSQTGSTGLGRSRGGKSSSPWLYTRWLLSVHRPMLSLYNEPGVILPGFALLLYNMTQAYLFPALMVYTALRFSFTGRQNGYLISIAAATSAIYLFSIYYALPRLMVWLRGNVDSDDEADDCNVEAVTPHQSSTADFVCATTSMTIQLFVLPCIFFITAGWQIFPLVSLLALGLAAPSFLKSYGVSLAMDKSAAVASLAMMESIGGLLSAMLLGSWQIWKDEGSVFFAASGLVAAALLAILGSSCISPRRS